MIQEFHAQPSGSNILAFSARSYTLLDGSTIRTPGSGVWTADGINMENYGVPPDVFVDNTASDFFRGRDAQLEKAVEVLKEQLGSRRPTSQQ